MAVALFGIVLSVVSSFAASGVSAASLGGFAASPAVRALYGVPYDISSAGGFTVWRSGSFVLVIAGLWAVMATTRVLRGEEEAGRFDLVLAAPVGLPRLVAGHLVVLSIACVVAGVAVTTAFLVGGEPATGSVLYGSASSLFTLTFVGLGAVASQLFGQRRRAAGIAGLVLGATYVLRMLADGSEGLSWARWLTPFGWVASVQAFAADRWLPLVPLALLPLALLGAAVALSARRDLGDGVVHDADVAEPRVLLLAGPVGFAWRQRLGGLAGWVGGAAMFGLVIGSITVDFSEFLASNLEMQKMMARFGFGSMSTPAGFLGAMAGFLGVLFSLQAVSGLHLAWADEQQGRLDLALAQPVTRTRWLGAQVMATTLAVLCAVLASAVCAWLGVWVGGADLAFTDSLAASANTLPLVALFLGLAVLVHGVVPRAGVAASGGLVLGAYLLSFLGPLIELPSWLLDVSPFVHLAYVPADPVDWAASAVMAGLGIGAGAVGFVAYQRRDLA